jgi:fatty acid-binding protein DegV
MGTDLLGRPTTEAEDELLELYRRCKALLARDDLDPCVRAGARVATVGLWNAVNDLALTSEQLLDLGA